MSLARAVDWNINERFVCTSREFWQLILLIVDGIFLMPKLRKKLDLQSRCVPVSCCWLEYQWTWCLHEPWVLATYFSCCGLNFFSAKTQRKVRFTIEVCPCLVCLKKRLLYFCAFLTFSFGYVKIVLWKYCLLMWWDFVLVWEEL